nr:integrase, catalytic region, zinc finger, CCHC-type, peptidase aspartic, catalytic [Tanacetum cinerariifolium]
MNYLEEKTDGEAMINSIQNGDQPLIVIALVLLAENAQNVPPTLKDPKFWTAKEKKTRKIDRLVRSLLILGLSNDIYSLIDSNETTTDLWDALERQMRGSEYGEQDRKAAILYEQTKNLIDINIDALYNILKQNQGDVNDALGYKKKSVVITSDPLTLVVEKTKVSKRKEKVVVSSDSEEFVKSDDKKVKKKDDEKKRDMSKVKCYNCKKERLFAKDCKKAKVKDYNYYKTKMLLAKKDSDEQVLSESDESSSSAEETIVEQTSSLKPYVPTVILEKIIIDLEDEVVSLLEKEKANLKTIKSLKSKGFESSENAIFETENQSENDCHMVEKDCDNVENPNVIAPGMFKLSVLQSVSPISMSKTSCDSKNVENCPDLSLDHRFGMFKAYDGHLKMNKDVKRYSRKELLSCNNNSHLEETSSAYVCNDAMNVSCNSRLYDSFDENNFFIFDDENVRISPVSKMPFKKKPRDSMNIVQICLWIIDSGCSKHMTGNRAPLKNLVEKFFGTVRFGNNDFTVIASYGDVVIGSMTIKKVYYVEDLGHNLFSIGQFCDKGLEVAFRKSTCFVQN